MRRMGARARDARGQSTVEAAVALPVVFLLVLLLVQPGIVLYDRMVMAGAADVARVTVRTEVRPLPLLDGGATLLGMVNERGNLVVEVTAMAPTRASWAQESLNGASVNGKAGEWRHEG